MGYAFVIILIVAAIAAAIYGASLANRGGSAPPPEDMGPTSIDEFKITKASEGMVIPIIFGRIRMAGNILWFGNLETVEITESITVDGGGKLGGGSSSETHTYVIGYKYYLDIWFGLSMGPLQSITKFWVNDKPRDDLSENTSSYIFNNGAQWTYPSDFGSWANALYGQAHISYTRLYIGENVKHVANYEYLQHRQLSLSLPSVNMSWGINPAAMVYQVLLDVGATASDFNYGFFSAASTYWGNNDYALNLAFGAHTTVRKIIARIMGFVDGYFGVDNDNKFIIKAFNPDDNASYDLDDDNGDFESFLLSRRTWPETSNVFRGNYIDKNMGYTKRTVEIINPANIEIVGHRKPFSVDLTAYIYRPYAEKRLWGVMRRMSYPEATIRFTCLFKWMRINLGDVITITHSDYGLNGAYYRVVSKDIAKIDENKVSFVAMQMVEKLFDTNVEDTDGPEWEPVDDQPIAPDHQQIFELPYNSVTGYDPAYLLLSTKGTMYETGFRGSWSAESGGSYTTLGHFGDNAQYGTLQEAYPDTTFNIDDDIGILYQPWADRPKFYTQSRDLLFVTWRVIIIGNEMMAFETVTPEGDDDYRLTGVIRGLMNTPIESHSNGSPVWLVNITHNVLGGLTTNDFYLKMIPHAGGLEYDESLVSAHHVIATGKAAKPHTPFRLQITRITGTPDDIEVTWWPISKESTAGCGTFDPGGTADTTYPLSDVGGGTEFEFEGGFEYRINGGTWVTKSDNCFYSGTIATGSNFTFEVRATYDFFTSGIISGTVNSGVFGDYYFD